MNIIGALTLFGVLLIVFQIITEVFTVLFRFTGLPAEKARFQVTSLLTACGFTTSESEVIISTPRRRKLARRIMLFGYAFTVSIVSAIVNIFLSLNSTEMEFIFWQLPIPIVILALLILVRKEKHVNAALNRFIERIAERLMFGHSSNRILLLDYMGDNAIAQVDIVELPTYLADVQLRDCGLREQYGLLVMLIERKNRPSGPIHATDVLQSGDRLIVCGHYDKICRAFEADERELEAVQV